MKKIYVILIVFFLGFCFWDFNINTSLSQTQQDTEKQNIDNVFKIFKNSLSETSQELKLQKLKKIQSNIQKTLDKWNFTDRVIFILKYLDYLIQVQIDSYKTDEIDLSSFLDVEEEQEADDEDSNEQKDSCPEWYHMWIKNCVSNTNSCDVENGKWQKTWEEDSWWECKVIECDEWYEQDLNQCVESWYMYYANSRMTWCNVDDIQLDSQIWAWCNSTLYANRGGKYYTYDQIKLWCPEWYRVPTIKDWMIAYGIDDFSEVDGNWFSAYYWSKLKLFSWEKFDALRKNLNLPYDWRYWPHRVSTGSWYKMEDIYRENDKWTYHALDWYITFSLDREEGRNNNKMDNYPLKSRSNYWYSLRCIKE